MDHSIDYLLMEEKKVKIKILKNQKHSMIVHK